MANLEWYLFKHSDREVHGPVELETLRSWATEAKISPLDKISRGNRTDWERAPLIEELQMDWLIEMPDNYLYGPTNLGAVQEFLAIGEIDENVRLINCATGMESQLADMPFYQDSPHHRRSAQTTFLGTQYTHQNPVQADSSTQLRLQHLEKQVVAYQRQVDEWQQAYESLKQQYIEAVGREP
jgi:hypothetical protein